MNEAARPRPRAEETPATAPAVQEWEPEVAVAAYPTSGPAWDGRRTRLRTAYVMMRNQEILVPGDTFEVEAVYDKAQKRWIGPEGPHVEQLFALGQILGSKEAEDRSRLQAAVEHERGVHPTRQDPEGRPDLAPYPPEEVRRQWLRVLTGGQGQLTRRERQESRSGDASTDYLAQKLAEVLAGVPSHAGSEAPGTAITEG